MPLRFSAFALAVLASAAPALAQPVSLVPLGTYRTGVFDEGAAEIAAYDPASRRLFFVNAAANTVTALDAADPSNPTFLFNLDLAAFGGGANSVAIKNGLVAVAVEADEKTDPGRVVFLTSDGLLLGSVLVGALPDALTFSPDGRYVVVACEGEPNGDYTVDPEGTVAVIDLAGGVPGAVALAHFADFNAGGPRYDEITGQPSIRIFGPGATVAQDLEPEFAAVSPDGATAYVTLQENNAVAAVDLATAAVLAIRGLGFKDHGAAGSGLDASDDDGAINIRTWPVRGMYQPDGVATFESGGRTYFVTANEGDARDYDAFAEEERVGDLALDPDAFTDAAALQADSAIGRLNVTTATGDADGDGDFDALFSFGARSFSIRSGRTGALVWDSGDELEQLTAARYPAYFNAGNTDNEFDSRSDNKGAEPEGVVVGEVGGRPYAFVGLERIGGVVTYDLTEPAAPAFAGYTNNRDFTADPETPEAGDLGPEGLVFIAAGDSPTGLPLLVTSNEVSGTVTFFEVNVGLFVAIEPESPPVVIPAEGGQFAFTATLTNETAQTQTFEAWTQATLPDGSLAGPEGVLLGPVIVTLGPGQTLTRRLVQRMPAGAPAGPYTYTAYVGGYPGAPVAADAFPGAKAPPLRREASAVVAGSALEWTAAYAEGGAPVAAGDRWTADVAARASSEGSKAEPAAFALLPAVPNPASAFSVPLALPEPAAVRVEVYDLLGRRVAVLADGPMAAGTHRLGFDGAGRAAGMYVVRATVTPERGAPRAFAQSVTLLR